MRVGLAEGWAGCALGWLRGMLVTGCGWLCGGAAEGWV